MNHRVGRSLFALAVGLIIAGLAYQWITDPAPRVQREAEERAVLAAREVLENRIGDGGLEIVDPLLPNRKVGKVYVYAEGPGWAISGFYRRDDADSWRPYLIYLDQDLSLHSFRAGDATIEAR
jgi:hypothetical protein